MSHLKVLFLSNWFSNPYKTLLIKNLQIQNIEVEEHWVSRFFLLKALQIKDLNVIHFHKIPLPLTWKNPISQAFKFFLFIIQTFILRQLGIKIVWTIHEWDQKLSSKKVSFNPLYAKAFSSCFDAFITHCETAKTNLVQELGPQTRDKTHVIYHGNYIDWYKNTISAAAARNALNIAAEAFVFLLFGSIYPHKGVLEAITAFQTMDSAQAQLLIVGSVKSEELRTTIESQIETSENIRLISARVEDDDVQTYMNASNCVLLPYKVFTTSGVAVLAMSFGRACIAPAMGFFTDVLDDSGTFFYNPDEDVAGLNLAMTKALEYKEKVPEMGNYNRDIVERWNWNYVSTETAKVYDLCLKSYRS
ncbi:MAG: glycosyltransferase family 4 protein [Cyanobacteria bacterium J06636_16]